MEDTQGQRGGGGQERFPSSQQWEAQKDSCFQLYVEENKSLSEVREVMARRGHIATPRMFKHRFHKWGFGKYTSDRDWKAFVVLRALAKAKGTELREVEIHNRIRRLPELERYLQRQNISEENFLREAETAGVFVPNHVRSIAAAADKNEGNAITGEQNGESVTKHPSLQRYHPYSISRDHDSNHSQAFTEHGAPQSTCSRMLFEDDDSNHSQGCTRYGAPRLTPTRMSFELSGYLLQAVDPSSGIMTQGPSYANLTNAVQMEANAPDPVFHRQSEGWGIPDYSVGWFDLGLPSQISSDEDPSPPLPMPIAEKPPDPTVRYVQTRQHHAFMGDVSMACMSDASKEANEVDLAKVWMQQALIKLPRLCADEDPMFLVITHAILVWLQVHVTESRAESFIREISQAVSQQLGKEHLISLTLEDMTAAAGKRMPNSRISLDTMRQVVRDFGVRLGSDHPHTLIARYYMCFHMMRVERKFVEAEVELTKLYEKTSRILGQSSFQAVCVLATLSRAQSRQDKHDAALDTINRCLREAPLGLNHPHRLELLNRKAIICGHIMDKLKPEEKADRQYWNDQMEELYWTVTKGRIATLGAYHHRTQAAHDSLVKILVDTGKFDAEAVKEDTINILKNPQLAVSDYQSLWRDMVRKHREGEGEV